MSIGLRALRLYIRPCGDRFQRGESLRDASRASTAPESPWIRPGKPPPGEVLTSARVLAIARVRATPEKLFGHTRVPGRNRPFQMQNAKEDHMKMDFFHRDVVHRTHCIP
jgi:hypothetical protein